MATSLSFSISPTTITTSRFRLSAMAAAATTRPTKVTPAVIVGGGRVGRALQDMGTGEDLLVRRGESVPLDFEGPIFVCTRNDDLELVLQSTPPSRWKGESFCYDFVIGLEDVIDELLMVAQIWCFSRMEWWRRGLRGKG
ncbi:hypothetical protein V8G54_035889 [Vigna mungo]|uniref:Uncharacterized protein n=1 Tax=Vigna mungo TaxID=3915 RepID=A0AAQ3MFX1_VIGMU